MINIIKACRGCQASEDRLDTVLTMERMPLAGLFCRSEFDALGAETYPLTWVRCNSCGAVQVAEDIPDSQLFREYSYASSTVPGLVRHFADFSRHLAEFYGDHTRLNFLEIGCNDGVLMRYLPRGWRRIGVDPSDVALRASLDSDWELINRPFTPECVREHRLEGQIGVICGSNCLAHISDLRRVFAGAALALRAGGHFWIEVHNLESTIESAQWDTIYHEHKVEWSEAALIRCLALEGFAHEVTYRLPLHGGLLRIRFRRENAKQPTPSGAAEIESGLSDLRDAYMHRAETPSSLLLARLHGAGRRISAYGAAGRANVYLNQMRHLKFAYIVDESPLRAGKFIPCTATPIVGPEMLEKMPVDACLITAWNYRQDIVAKAAGHSGLWVTAFNNP